jgi:tRNA-dihydrouridine synthase B
MGKMIEAMVNVAGDIPISVKLRLGKSDGKINILETAKVAEESGAATVIVHARTQDTKYKDEPTWDWLNRVKDSVKIPVIGNGSLFTPQNIKSMMEETNVDGVMIARGALGNPFIFNRYRELIENGSDPGEPSLEEIEEAAVKHSRLIAREYSERVATIKAKKNIIWYFKHLDGVDKLTTKIMSAKSIDVEIKIIHDHVENLKQNFYPSNDRELVNQKFKERVLFWLDE